MQTSLLQYMSQADIGLITWSDDTPVTILRSLLLDVKRYTPWHMNTSLFEQECQEQIKLELKTFFELNFGSIQNNHLLWNSHKSFMRVIFIKLEA